MDPIVLAEVERLVAELRAIERWDVYFWRADRREPFEVVAFRNRRKRRSEILARLLIITRTRPKEKLKSVLGVTKSEQGRIDG